MSRFAEATLLSVLLSPIFAILFSIPITAFYVGFTRYNDCPALSMLPSRLLIFGIFGFICTLLSIGLFVRSSYEVDDTGLYQYKFVFAIGIFIVYMIAALVWAIIVTMDLNSSSNDGMSSCDPLIIKSCTWISRGAICVIVFVLGWFLRNSRLGRYV